MENEFQVYFAWTNHFLKQTCKLQKNNLTMDKTFPYSRDYYKQELLWKKFKISSPATQSCILSASSTLHSSVHLVKAVGILDRVPKEIKHTHISTSGKKNIKYWHMACFDLYLLILLFLHIHFYPLEFLNIPQKTTFLSNNS